MWFDGGSSSIKKKRKKSKKYNKPCYKRQTPETRIIFFIGYAIHLFFFSFFFTSRRLQHTHTHTHTHTKRLPTKRYVWGRLVETNTRNFTTHFLLPSPSSVTRHVFFLGHLLGGGRLSYALAEWLAQTHDDQSRTGL